jgi:hypothetical protein
MPLPPATAGSPTPQTDPTFVSCTLATGVLRFPRILDFYRTDHIAFAHLMDLIPRPIVDLEPRFLLPHYLSVLS